MLGVFVRFGFGLSVVLALVSLTACARTSIPVGSSLPADRSRVQASRHDHGYYVKLHDGRTEFIDDPVAHKTKNGKRGPLLAFSGKGFALAIQVGDIDTFERIDGAVRTKLAVPTRSVVNEPPRTAHGSLTDNRRALLDPVCGVDGCFGGGGGTCNATEPQCNTCPDCSIQLPSVGDPIDCYYTPSCGDDGNGNKSGTGLIPTDPETTCLYDFSSGNLDCGYNNRNPQPSRPSSNLSMGYLHSGFSARLACNISAFAPLPVVGFAIYKDSSQVFTKSRETALSPDYWFVPDETGKPIPPPPPAHTSISAQYEYFGFPFLVAGHCDGSD